ncbi:hypothetical protein [Sphingomonas sp. Leaf17]|uniref:hypothetical protein n=1 Tax=Sphingomonas sp. Leaf17 TaxID=1735683 RepID=UPI001F2395A2|nr:hypothetical protein [Sphingomonas sp. Leaf17]
MALACATTAAARDLPVPADKGWKHAPTGLILTRDIAGMPRTTLTDATETEHDVAAQFELPDKSVFVTIYIFRSPVADPSLWFDRSRTALEGRDIYRHAAPATIEPVAFAAGTARSASSLRQVYAVPDGPYRSTALAVVPVGGWIVAIRMSATTLKAAQLDARLTDVIAAIRWPTTGGDPAPAAVPIKACPAPLAFVKAKVAKANGADMLMSLLGASVAARTEAATAARAATWCREGSAHPEYGVYRADGEASGYIMALSDAGRVVSVTPSLMGQVDKTGTYTVSLQDVDGTTFAYPSFTAMPRPEQVRDLVLRGQPTGSGKDGSMKIDPKAI